jgi:hypothetical protein
VWASLVDSREVRQDSITHLVPVAWRRGRRSTSKSEERREKAIHILFSDLSSVRGEALREYRWFKETGAEVRAADQSPQVLTQLTTQRKQRLVFLFVKDLIVTSVARDVMSSTERRDTAQRMGIAKVLLSVKVLCGFLIGAIDVTLLYSLYLFANHLPQSLQYAWCTSLALWFAFEIFISSSGVVLLLHLLVPLLFLPEVQRAKERALYVMIADLDHCQEEGQRRRSQAQGQGLGSSFNAAQYLFPSYRVAALLPDLPTSRAVASFRTSLPRDRQRYQAQVLSLSGLIKRLCSLFLSSILSCHELLQEVMAQMAHDTIAGLLIVLTIGFFRINAILIVIPLLLTSLGVYLILTRRNKSRQSVPTIQSDHFPMLREVTAEPPDVSPLPLSVASPSHEIESGVGAIVPQGSGGQGSSSDEDGFSESSSDESSDGSVELRSRVKRRELEQEEQEGEEAEEERSVVRAGEQV